MENVADPAVMRILVAVDGESDLEVVDHGVALARQNNARLELIGGIPRLWLTSAYALDCARLEVELVLYAQHVLKLAVDRVDDDLPLTLRHVRGRASDHLLRRHEDAPGDLLLVRGGRRRLRPARRRRLGTLLRVPVGRPAGAVIELA
jgi:hypothetical protein